MTKLVELSESILITAYISAFYTYRQESKLCIDQYFGYSDYLYLDDELIDIEHLCCLAHARAKLWYAQEQGKLTGVEIMQKTNDLYNSKIIDDNRGMKMREKGIYPVLDRYRLMV